MLIFITIYDTCNLLEKHYRDIEDIEFTIENENYSYCKLEMEREQLKQLLELLWIW